MFYTPKEFQAYPKLLSAISLKNTDYPYHFSLALHTGEELQKILENRKKLSTQIAPHYSFVIANQTHSSHIQIIKEKKDQGYKEKSTAIEDCDGLISNVKGVVLSILTADCVPLLFYDKVKHIIAVAHAGWRGTDKKIAGKIIDKMTKEFASNPKDIIVHIAPSIRGCCYEVGFDVAKHFLDFPKALVSKDNDKYMLDLAMVNKEQLVEKGLPHQNITLSKACTSCENERFFSYRKEKGCTGRFLSLIALKP